MNGCCGENPVRVSVVFTCNEPNRPSWPYINYDCKGRAERIMETLCMRRYEWALRAGS